MIFILTLLVITLYLVECVIQISPCPNIFTYQKFNESGVGVWVALITVPRPFPPLPMKLKVNLYLKAVLPTKYVGMLELTEPRDALLHRVTYDGISSVSYLVHFPLQSPLPTVKNISLNNNILCVGPQVSGPVITTIHLEHKVFPMNNIRTGTELSNRTETPKEVSDEGFKRPHLSDINECGQAIETNHLILKGKPARRGQWPWLAAIYVGTSLGLNFHCSATVISSKFVITAAHCLDHEETGRLHTDVVFIYLGKFNLKYWTEQGTVLKEACKIFIHPKYSRSSYGADLAIIEFEPVKFTIYIQPACLWTGTTTLEPYLNQLGMVAGWGSTNYEQSVNKEPNLIELPLVEQEECIRSHKDFEYILSETTLCAGNRNGSGPCNGDSGSGLLILNRITERWELRGVTSLSLLNTTSNTCNLNEYLVFTDVAKLFYWIKSIIK